MMTPLERAAQAVYETRNEADAVAYDGPLAGIRDSCDQLHPRTRVRYSEEVRAALTAIREPSLKMLAAGRKTLASHLDDEGPSPQALAERTWQAMIDAALAEQG